MDGMVWVGLGLPPGFNHSKGSAEDLNRLGASVGAMAQADDRDGTLTAKGGMPVKCWHC